VSNLTNLLAFAASGLSFVRFAALMALPWLAAIVARDSDHHGPKSLAPATRFVVDHARCPILLVWP
jgi:hypothetical protein